MLWIDDCDTKSASDNIDYDFLEGEQEEKADNDNSEVGTYFGKNFENDVKLIKNFSDAIKELNSNHTMYDLVIFDVNMKEEISENDFDPIKEALEKNGVLVKKEAFSEKNNEYDNLRENAGLYLYLYLLNLGYPSDRMVILSAYANSNSIKENLEEICIRISDNNLIEKTADMDNNSIWKNFYSEKKDYYYCVRRMVYKACEYWKEWLETLENETRSEESSDKDPSDSIEFNKIYYSKPKNAENNKGFDSINSKKKDIDAFISMLNRVELLFPIVYPINCEQVYYYALQAITAFHEESADIEKLSKEPNLKKYHQAVRNFRNWSAHNKFKKTELPAELFAYLFCISLRTYFDGDFNNPKEKECHKEYEEEIFSILFSDEIENREDWLEKGYLNDWKYHFKCVLDNYNREIVAKKEYWNCKDITQLLLKSGKSGGDMQLTDCILSIITPRIIQKDMPDRSYSTQEGGKEYTYQYTYTVKCKWIFKAKEWNENDYFEKYACELYVMLKKKEEKN